MEVLSTLAGRASKTVVTLPLYSEQARETLVRDFGFIEERLTGNHRGTPSPETIVCNSRRDEVDYVADEIVRLVREHGFQFRRHDVQIEFHVSPRHESIHFTVGTIKVALLVWREIYAHGQTARSRRDDGINEPIAEKIARTTKRGACVVSRAG